MLEDEGGDGCADSARADGDADDPLNGARAGFRDSGFDPREADFESVFELVDFRFDTGDIGFGGDRFGERVAESVGGGSGLLLGERSGFEPIDVGEAVEEDLGGHGR